MNFSFYISHLFKKHFCFVFLSLIFVGHLYAQGVTPPPPEDEPEKATAKESPVKPPPPKAQVIEEDEPQPEKKPGANPAGATETPPPDIPATDTEKHGDKDKERASPNPGEEMPPLSEMTPLTPKVKKSANEGIQIHVEKVNGASSSETQTGKVKLTSPWPAKPLDAPPLGWKYIPAPEGVDPYRTTVKLGVDQSVNLAITPYVLVPVSDGRHVIRISEPGYQPSQSYMQESTIGSLLLHSTEEIERNEKLTSAAIQRLQRLLSSLPQPTL